MVLMVVLIIQKSDALKVYLSGEIMFPINLKNKIICIKSAASNKHNLSRYVDAKV